MLLPALKTCLLRELAGLDRELEAYPDDASVWLLPEGISNSTGTLVLHCCGNLRHFFGAMFAGGSYVRDRDAEFATRDLPRAELHALIAITSDELSHAIDRIDEASLPPRLPFEFSGGHPDTTTFLVHLATHIAYHVGQADVHRRVVTGERRPVGAMGVRELFAGAGG
jgi:hypothetical protein